MTEAAGVAVLIYHRAGDGTAVQEAYDNVSRSLAGVPGMLGNELLHSVHDATGFVVLSRWRDLDAFQRWEQGAGHRDATAPLRPFRDDRFDPPYGVYRCLARH